MMLVFISEAARIILRRLVVGLKGFNKYTGSPEQVCSSVVRDCYNHEKKYFMTSTGHFCEFYARDFGWCAEALLSLGYSSEVMDTLEYAFSVFERHGGIEQSISPNGRPFTFPPSKYSPDALAFLIHALRLSAENKFSCSRALKLIKNHQDFINKEIRRYYEIVIDDQSGLVRKDVYFSSIKDYALRLSSCYDNCVTGMLASDLAILKKKSPYLVNPFKKHNYQFLIMKHFWNGSHFLDDLSGYDEVCGDANVMPFWTGLITDKKVLGKALDSMRKEGLDRPFPLKYTSSRIKTQKMIKLEFFVGDYERSCVWPHIGLMFIKVVGLIDKELARNYLRKYEKIILENHNFLEVYDSQGNPFSNLLYCCDEGMLWAANYLHLKKSLL